MLTDQAELLTLVKKLESVMADIRPQFDRIVPGYDKKTCAAAVRDMIDCDEVYPNIILGSGQTARNKKYLKKIGVTHILNTAMGNGFGKINTNQKFYEDVNMAFLGFEISDLPSFKISTYFEQVINFIGNALDNHGKVFVHCLLGVSRSSTCVIAFLMIKRGMSCEEALQLVRSRRFVVPNEGFLLELARLDIKLRERRELAQSQEQLTKHCQTRDTPNSHFPVQCYII